MSRPRSAHSPALFFRLPACSDNWPRSSEPAFGAKSMPRPAPRTVPVSRPITKLPPPPPSLSKRSYPSAIDALLLGSCFRMEHSFDCDAQPADESDEPARLRAHVRAHAIGGGVDAIHRRVNRHVDAFGLFLDFCRDGLHIVEDRVDPQHRRRNLPRL